MADNPFQRPSTPAAPDYTAAANATAAGNLDAARAGAAANRINQYTPYGSLRYSIDKDAQGNDVKDPYGNYSYRQDVDLSPAGQKLLDQQNKLGQGLFSSQDKSLDYINKQLENPIDTGKLASVGIRPGEEYQDAILRKLEPTQNRQNQQLETQLTNQGIPRNSEAWNNAKEEQSRAQADQRTSAITGGFNVGLNARQQGLTELGYLRNEPINTLASLRTGSQVQNPTFQPVAQQATTSGADLTGAARDQYSGAWDTANANNAYRAKLLDAGTKVAMAAAGSDIRIKENIVQVGNIGGLPVYEWEYKDEYKDLPLAGQGRFIGFMAQDVELVAPHAVFEIDGIKYINYGVLQ